MTTYLDDIVAYHRKQAASDDRRESELLRSALAMPPARGFARALTAEPTVAVIAEVKRRSPSKGALALELDPVVLASAYEAAGAACVSVLTDGPHFAGSAEDLIAARGAVEIPVLRKDFTVSRADVLDARIMGADAVLLIVAALDDAELRDFSDLAAEIGLDVLVEVHDEAELARALSAGVSLIGVNQRDLATFTVDTTRAVRVAQSIPDGIAKVAESGVRGRDDVELLADAGFDAVLVGEALVTDGDPAAALRRLRGQGGQGAQGGQRGLGEVSPCS